MVIIKPVGTLTTTSVPNDDTNPLANTFRDHLYTNHDTLPCAQYNSFPNPHCDTNPNTNCDTHPNIDRDAYQNTHEDTHQNTHPYLYENAYAQSHFYLATKSNGDSQGDSHNRSYHYSNIFSYDCSKTYKYSHFCPTIYPHSHSCSDRYSCTIKRHQVIDWRVDTVLNQSLGIAERITKCLDPQRFVQMDEIMPGWWHQQQAGHRKSAPINQQVPIFRIHGSLLDYLLQSGRINFPLQILRTELPGDITRPASNR